MKTQEIRKALVTIVKESVRISEDELLLATSRLFGFMGLGPDLKERIIQVLEKPAEEFIRSKTVIYLYKSELDWSLFDSQKKTTY